MKIVSLSNAMKELFVNMDPFDIMGKVKDKDCFICGIIDNQEAVNHQVGLLVGTYFPEHITINWMYVLPEYRSIGVSEGIINMVFQLADSKSLDRIYAVIPDAYGSDIVCANAKSYILNHQFVKTERPNNDDAEGEFYCANTYEFAEREDFYSSIPSHKSDIKYLMAHFDKSEVELYTDDFEDSEEDKTETKNEKYKNIDFIEYETKSYPVEKMLKAIKNYPKVDKAIPIGELSIQQFEEGLKACVDNKLTGILKNPLEVGFDYYNLNLSSCIMNKEKVTGMLLAKVDTQNNSVIPVILSAWGDDIKIDYFSMVTYLINKTNELYPQIKEIVFPWLDGQGIKLMNTFK